MSAADEVIELAALAGLPLDPWQQFVLRHGMGMLSNQQWAAFIVSVWVARQNGKGGIIEALELAWLFLFGEKLIMHSAHEYKTAQEAFLRIKGLIESTPDLDRRVNRYWQANGEQGIELTTGQRLRFVARSRTSGRGFTGHKNILDEGQELTLNQMAALLPTMSAVPNPQVWVFGTPPDDPAAWVYALKEAGEAGVVDDEMRLAHFDWGVDMDPTDPEDLKRQGDRDLWYAANPALGIRITPQFLGGELKLLKEKFAAEHLGVWLPKAVEGSGLIDLEKWATLAYGEDDEAEPDADIAIAIDIQPGRGFASIGIAGWDAAGYMHLQVIEHRPGTAWIVDRLVELRSTWKPVGFALDPKSPAGSLLLDLEEVGITPPEDPEKPQRGDLLVLSLSDVAAACGQVLDGIEAETDRHIDQEQLNSAVAGVKERTIGDGAMAFGRRATSIDISPLCAVTFARFLFKRWAHLVQDDRPPNLW